MQEYVEFSKTEQKQVKRGFNNRILVRTVKGLHSAHSQKQQVKAQDLYDTCMYMGICLYDRITCIIHSTFAVVGFFYQTDKFDNFHANTPSALHKYVYYIPVLALGTKELIHDRL